MMHAGRRGASVIGVAGKMRAWTPPRFRGKATPLKTADESGVFYDTHAHLTWRDFAGELPEIVARARAAGITRIITIGTDAESSRRAVAIAEQFDEVFAAVGWHPGDVDAAPEDVRPELCRLLAHPKVVAVGETGLDYYRLPSTRGGTAADDASYQRRQMVLFRQQMELAGEAGKNVVIHTRGDCFEDTIRVVEEFAGRVRTVFHCFGEPVANLERVLATGSLVSFTGILTFKNGTNVREALKAAPPGRFMLETDSPFLAPVPFRGRRCEPAYVREIAAAAAGVRGCSAGELGEVTCAAARGFFAGLS